MVPEKSAPEERALKGSEPKIAERDVVHEWSPTAPPCATGLGKFGPLCGALPCPKVQARCRMNGWS